MKPCPELSVPKPLAASIRRRATEAGDEAVEAAGLAGELDWMSLEGATGFRGEVLSLWQENDHLVLRGAPVGVGAVMLLSSILGARFKPYRGARVVKHFRMSPWTLELSHTTREGEFHTDINTAPEQPRTTVIQGVVADPAGPPHGDLRVARIADVNTHLRTHGEWETLSFLEQEEVTMLNDHSHQGWSGRILTSRELRYHPETLRAARRRFGSGPPELDRHIQRIHDAAMAVSTPIYLEPGDTLVVSNARALHRRGACSVSFRSFPMDFIAREVHVLHLLDDPT